MNIHGIFETFVKLQEAISQNFEKNIAYFSAVKFIYSEMKSNFSIWIFFHEMQQRQKHLKFPIQSTVAQKFHFSQIWPQMKIKDFNLIYNYMLNSNWYSDLTDATFLGHCILN